MTDDMLGRRQVESLIEVLRGADPGNPFTAVRQTAVDLGPLTLSGRARALAEAMLADIRGDSARLARVVRDALNDPSFEGWQLWPVGIAIARRSIDSGSTAAFDDGMAVLRELTPRMTSEFAVRPLLRHDLRRALGHMREWAGDPDWNVRRLASEGSRPLLPWAERIPELVLDPSPALPILDALYDDPEESVRRSVANHLNDHSRAHAAFTVETVEGWRTRGGTHVDRTARHALRTLVKRGDRGALEFLGFTGAELEVAPLVVSPETVQTGGSVRFGATIENTGSTPANLMIDYTLFFPDARGAERTKVFKIAQRRLRPGERTGVEGSHSFREITTRRYYPGRYGVALQVNGVVHERTGFTVGR